MYLVMSEREELPFWGQVVVAVLVIGLMAGGAFWMCRESVSSQKFSRDVQLEAAYLVQGLAIPAKQAALPVNGPVMRQFGPVTFTQDGGRPLVRVGPMGNDQCFGLLAALGSPDAPKTKIWLDDATLDTWELRYREAKVYYPHGPHGVGPPVPCDVVKDEQRIIRVQLS